MLVSYLVAWNVQACELRRGWRVHNMRSIRREGSYLACNAAQYINFPTSRGPSWDSANPDAMAGPSDVLS